MQPLSRKLMLVIASLLIPVLFAEEGTANPSVFKTPVNKPIAVANIVQQTIFKGSQRRAQSNRLSEPQAIAVDTTAGRLYWTDTGTHQIYRANLNGSRLEILVALPKKAGN